VLYEPHSPIVIHGNANFSATAAAEEWPGNGILTNPYVIDSLNITGSLDSNLIEIRNTTTHFRISNCLFNQGKFGICFINVSTGYIANNIVTNNTHYGIFLNRSENIIISGNTITNNRYYGIPLEFSKNNTLRGNTVINNSYGINFYYSENNTLLDNIIVKNNEGVVFQRSKNNIIAGNTVTNNIYQGISLYFSDNNTLTSNTIDNNSLLYSHGIFLNRGSNYNRVQNNSFFGNTADGSQAVDDGSNNAFVYNYWSDWTSPDGDADGIVDEPYPIGGEAKNHDPYPLVAPTTTMTKLSPGWTFILLLLSFIAMLPLRRRKKKT